MTAKRSRLLLVMSIILIVLGSLNLFSDISMAVNSLFDHEFLYGADTDLLTWLLAISRVLLYCFMILSGILGIRTYNGSSSLSHVCISFGVAMLVLVITIGIACAPELLNMSSSGPLDPFINVFSIGILIIAWVFSAIPATLYLIGAIRQNKLINKVQNK